ncbi:amidohydrolase family protein [Natronolimnohabitans sp. A-GB9]|uniref:amidohydrolase family protein n=1 Tax=Natronolimnohabitans sp. A-GB9 TaxID=3069757 RepID=UPI0027AFC6FA|nr:amidohydrolase family protein [Natronolimnohabitans sp. A-GB9]MDQ2051158.1 amidohydrolase family protein [Natronolimnohabitans sp. A-GB9]
MPEVKRRAEAVYAPEERLDRRSFLSSTSSRRSFLATSGVAASTLIAGCAEFVGGGDGDSAGQSNERDDTSGSDAVDDDTPTTLQGTIVVGEEMQVIEGTVEVADGRIERITEEGVNSDEIIVPAFVNPHTHITDSVAKDSERAQNYSWEELFIEPDLKGEILESASRKEKLESMSRTMEFMKTTGTGAFADFKEEGVQGVEDLELLDDESDVDATTLLTGHYLDEDDDLEEEIEKADGYNSYYPYDETDERAREICAELGKVFALHSGEPSAEDIDDSLALNPDYTSHMVHARPKDYDVMADNDIGLVSLPRSNLVIRDRLPPLEELHEATTVAIGTDNVMLNSASMLREMEFTSKLFDFTPTEVLQMATINGAKLIKQADDVGSIEEGKRARMTVIGTSKELKEVEDPVGGVVRRATAQDVKRIVLE